MPGHNDTQGSRRPRLDITGMVPAATLVGIPTFLRQKIVWDGFSERSGQSGVNRIFKGLAYLAATVCTVTSLSFHEPLVFRQKRC